MKNTKPRKTESKQRLARPSRRPLLGSIAALLFCAAAPAFAGSSFQWTGSQSSDYNTQSNWNPAFVPNGPADVATFGVSPTTTLSLSSSVEVNSIVFNAGASAYTITVPSTSSLTLSGVGISNNSVAVQKFVTAIDSAGGSGSIFFKNSASAGSNTIFVNSGATASGGFAGANYFEGTSTAGSATFINDGSQASGGDGGFIQFKGTATAGSASFTNNGASSSGAAQKFDATTGTFVSKAASGGSMEFREGSTAGKASFTNNGGAVGNASGGSVGFFDNSTAGSAKFINNPGTVGGTKQTFDLTTGAFVSDGAGGGGVGFHNNSTAGTGTFTNNAGAGGASGNGGGTLFFDTSTAGAGTFVNNGGAGSSGIGGGTQFYDKSNAGTATITSNGGTGVGVASTIGGIDSIGGLTLFAGSSTAASATLIANGGSFKGAGGVIAFIGDSTGGKASVKVLDNGLLDISLHSATGVTIGSLEGTGGVFLGRNPLSIGANDASTTFGGVIQNGGFASAVPTGTLAATTASAGGSLTKIGKGALTLTGANTYTGSTTVSAGSLVVNGSIASSKTIVNTGGALLGMGMIGGDLTNNSIAVPGNVPVPSGNLQSLLSSSGFNSITLNVANLPANQLVLNVKGNYTQSASGTLVIAYGGPAATQHTSLNVQGQANLGGTLRLIQVNAARLNVGDSVPIVTAAGGVNGKFANVVGANLLGEGVNVSYSVPNEVVLQLTGGTTTATLQQLGSLPPNIRSTARALDSAAGDPRAAAIFSAIANDTPSQLANDVQLISGQQLTAQNAIGNSVSNTHVQNISHRGEAVRGGATGFSSLGFHTAGTPYDSAAGYAGPAGPADKDSKEIAPPPNPRWGGFISGAGQWNRVGDTQQARGFSLDSGGITLGIDYKFTPNFVAGVFLGYTHTSIDIGQGGGIGVDVGKVGIYSTFFTGGFYLDTAVQGGYDGYTSRRAGLGGFARSDTHGGDLNVIVSPGYDFKVGALTIGPVASFQYGYQATNRFIEHDSLAPLSVDPTHTNSFISTIGMKATYDWKVGSQIIRPELRLSYQHEYGDVSTDVTSRLASGAGDAFTVTGPEIGRDSMLLGAGFAVVWSDRVTSYVYYDGEFFRTNYDSSAVSGGFRITF